METTGYIGSGLPKSVDYGDADDPDALIHGHISDLIAAEINDEVNDSGMEAGNDSDEEDNREEPEENDLIVLDPDHVRF